MPCGLGRYLEDNAMDAEMHDSLDDCIACARGEYGDTEGANSCVKCGPATYNPLLGQASSAACVACPAGTKGDEKDVGMTSVYECEICPKGYWNDVEGSTDGCTACPEGRTTMPLEKVRGGRGGGGGGVVFLERMGASQTRL
jgi:hypothetical protein